MLRRDKLIVSMFQVLLPQS